MFKANSRTIAVLILAAVLIGATPRSSIAGMFEPQAEIKFSGKVFEVKHRDPRALLGAVSQLGSGFKGTEMSFSDEFKTIAVRDFPENIAAIEEALKRLDTPEPSRPDIELRMHVLIADLEGGGGQMPSDLNDVVKQLQATLSYKSYSLISSIVQRVRDGANEVRGSGIARLSNQAPSNLTPSTAIDAPYQYEIFAVSASPGSGPGSALQLRRFSFHLRTNPNVLGEAGIKTDLGVRDGEKVVVGTASLKDKALVLVLSAKFVK